MYNFNFMEDEKLVCVFEDCFIKQNDLEKLTTVALTDKRLLFLDYITNDGLEALRISKGVNFSMIKEVYYEINLSDIEVLKEDEYYMVKLKNGLVFEFNNQELYKLLGSK